MSSGVKLIVSEFEYRRMTDFTPAGYSEMRMVSGELGMASDAGIVKEQYSRIRVGLSDCGSQRLAISDSDRLVACAICRKG